VRGREWGLREGAGEGGVMTQSLYAHMNKGNEKNVKRNKKNKSHWLNLPMKLYCRSSDHFRSKE
jgi:hypothetical protein